MKARLRNRGLILAILVLAGTAWAQDTSAPENGFDTTPEPPVDLYANDDAREPAEDDDWQRKTLEGVAEAMGAPDTAGDAGSEPQGPTDYSATRQIMQALAALAVVVAIILVLYYAMSRFGKKTPILAGASLGNVLGRIHLDPKTCLYFVRVKDRVLVVGVNPQSIATVAELDAALFEGKQADANSESAEDSFRQILEEKSGALAPPFATMPEAVDLAGLRDELEKVQQSLEALDAETKEETPREPS